MRRGLIPAQYQEDRRSKASALEWRMRGSRRVPTMSPGSPRRPADPGDLRRFLQPALRVPLPGQVRLRAHGPACIDPHQQGAPGTVQPLHLGARSPGARRIPRAGQRCRTLGGDRSAVRCDDRRPLRGRHGLQLRTLFASQYLPGDLAARRVFLSPAEQAASVLHGLRAPAPARRVAHGRGIDRLVPAGPGIFSAVPGSHRRLATHRASGSTRLLYASPDMPPPVALDVVEAGFFRDRSAFIVGRWVRERRQHRAVRGRRCTTAPRASTPTRCCIGSRTSTACSARRWPIFTSPPAFTIRPACFSTASCRAGRWVTTTPRSASITSARWRF